jgi:hypothetical protein
MVTEGQPMRVGGRPSCFEAASRFLNVRVSEEFAEFVFEQRLVGAGMHAASFDGILAEHALALEEARDLISKAMADSTIPLATYEAISNARRMLDEQITYLRSLGAVATTTEETES